MTIPYPGRTASSYLNPEIVPDLKDALALAGHILFRNRNEHPYLRTQIIGQLYAMMKILFDVLAGMLPCDEVVRLREAYDQFHNSDGRFGTFDEFLDRLRAVSRRFAAEEPKWERERAMSPYTNPAPVVPKAESFSSFASAGKRPRKQIPVKVAAAIFEVHENTINNWDKGKGRPKEYLGRDVGEAALREAADTYFLRRRNEEQAKKNRAAGLTHQSREPKSPFGPDSSRREYDSGNFIGTKNGERRPV